MTSTLLVGGTGLVGSYILSTLISHPSISSIHALSRRDPQTPSSKLHPLTSTDTDTWPSLLTTLTPPPSLFFSSLGTTRAQAGSIEAQRKIDHDLNLALATRVAQSRAPPQTKKIYILISTSGANPTSMIPYSRMKGELEEAVKALALGGNESSSSSTEEGTESNTGFNHVIILRPGLIVGTRSDSRPPEFVMRKVAGWAGWLNPGLKDFWAQDAEVIGRAAVNAGLRALEGKDGESEVPRVWELGMADIVRLGRTEWKEE
ncbi:hypothetical protein DSL72_007088 [Monilinia vaccinii-corymbosi]|uniref:NAD(P)-binding domain-containing protein n=1 Tax=Monilinia vaccinii-corymbosi TaxID=61207 RepID=A0A8A3PM80_9HELO|nr:hypothetical protein DSL72_007088 [Monilinia vaccinii-corymbosi]